MAYKESAYIANSPTIQLHWVLYEIPQYILQALSSTGFSYELSYNLRSPICCLHIPHCNVLGNTTCTGRLSAIPWVSNELCYHAVFQFACM